MSSSRIQAYFRKTRISAHDSELPICPACAILYMAKKRFFTEKTRSSSCRSSAERSARLDPRLERLSVTGSSLSYASPPNGGAAGHSSLEKFVNKIPSEPTVSGEDLCEPDSVGLLSAVALASAMANNGCSSSAIRAAEAAGNRSSGGSRPPGEGSVRVEHRRARGRVVLSQLTACLGTVVGTWTVTSSCLTLSGDMDVSLASWVARLSR